MARIFDSMSAYTEVRVAVQVFPYVVASTSSADVLGAFSNIIAGASSSTSNNGDATGYVSAVTTIAISMNGAVINGSSSSSTPANAHVIDSMSAVRGHTLTSQTGQTGSNVDSSMASLKYQMLVTVLDSATAVDPALLLSALASLTDNPYQVCEG